MNSKEWLWKGRPVTAMTREELLNVVECSFNQIENLRADRDRWREAGNASKYLMAGSRENRSEPV